jgi:uncharacterized protein DUF4259
MMRGMGTWEAGPFGNDAAMDFVCGVIDHIMGAVDEFMAGPQIDETFDAAFAAIALLNSIMSVTPARPWRNGEVVDGKPIGAALIRCFDKQIDDLQPKADFKVAQREALVAAVERFAAFLSEG